MLAKYTYMSPSFDKKEALPDPGGGVGYLIVEVTLNVHFKGTTSQYFYSPF